MKKCDLKKLTLMGITGGLLFAFQGNIEATTSVGNNDTENGANLRARYFQAFTQPNTTNTLYSNTGFFGQKNESRVLTEVELLSQIDKEGRTLYHSLDAEGKELARKLASAPGAYRDKKQAIVEATEQVNKLKRQKSLDRLRNGMK